MLVPFNEGNTLRLPSDRLYRKCRWQRRARPGATVRREQLLTKFRSNQELIMVSVLLNRRRTHLYLVQFQARRGLLVDILAPGTEHTQIILRVSSVHHRALASPCRIRW